MCGAELLTRRAVHAVVDMPLHRFDAHTHAHLFHPAQPGLIDPFLGLDFFHMPQNYFLPHPHGGMSAVTLLLADSPGGVRNRDSQGDDSVIAPGDLHWTQAGRGIVHEETPSQPGQAAIGLQVFVNMARHRKQDPAAVFKVARGDMPVLARDGATLTLVAGAFDGHVSPIARDDRWATPVTVLDIALAPHAAFDLPVPPTHNGFFVVTEGSLTAGDHAARDRQVVVVVPAAPAAVEGPPGVLALRAGPAGARGVWLSGQPLREPTVPHGPFVGNSRDDIVAYAQAFHRGAMGTLDASFSR